MWEKSFNNKFLGLMSFQLLFILILAPTPAASISPAPTPDPNLPQVEIYLLEANQTAHVGPGEDGIVEFNGIVSVTCDSNPLTHVEVTLTVVDTWGSSKVVPSKTTFFQSSEESFIVQVAVPVGESCDERGIIKVYGKWIVYPSGASGSAEPEEGLIGQIDIAQFFRFTLSVPQKYCETRPGFDVDFKLGIRNDGNGNDSFIIEILNQDTLSEKDFSVLLSQSKVVLSENAPEALILISIDIPSSTSVIGQNIIKINVYSENGLLEGLPPSVVRFVIDISRDYIYETNEFTISVLLLIFIVIICIILVWQWRKKRGLKD